MARARSVFFGPKPAKKRAPCVQTLGGKKACWTKLGASGRPVGALQHPTWSKNRKKKVSPSMAVVWVKGPRPGPLLRAFTPAPAPIHTQLLDFTASSNRARRLMGDASFTLGIIWPNKRVGGFILAGFCTPCTSTETPLSLYHLARS